MNWCGHGLRLVLLVYSQWLQEMVDQNATSVADCCAICVSMLSVGASDI